MNEETTQMTHLERVKREFSWKGKTFAAAVSELDDYLAAAEQIATLIRDKSPTHLAINDGAQKTLESVAHIRGTSDGLFVGLIPQMRKSSEMADARQVEYCFYCNATREGYGMSAEQFASLLEDSGWCDARTNAGWDNRGKVCPDEECQRLAARDFHLVDGCDQETGKRVAVGA